MIKLIAQQSKVETLYPLLFEKNYYPLVWGSESWEISAIDKKESVVANGVHKGKSINQLIGEYGALLLGKKVYETNGVKFPLLIKYIDAKQDLSIQVHPNDAMAKEIHGGSGKTEMWYVMDTEPGAFLYAGFKSRITPYEYQKRVEDGSICEVLCRYEVKKGDVFYIPAGRIHAICGGCYIAEIQQSSDITYRIFDYKRRDLDGNLRELHTDLAARAIDYSVLSDYATHYKSKINKPNCIVECPYFTTKLLEVDRAFHRKLYKYSSFVVYMCLEGEAKISLKSWEKFDKSNEPCIKEVSVGKGSSCLIPAGVADFDVKPVTLQVKLLEVYVNGRDF